MVEISDDETGGEYKEEPVPTPPRRRRTAPKGTPSSPSPIKAKFVLFHHIIIFLFYTQYHIFSGKKRNIITPNQDAELTVIPRYVLSFSVFLNINRSLVLPQTAPRRPVLLL